MADQEGSMRYRGPGTFIPAGRSYYKRRQQEAIDAYVHDHIELDELEDRIATALQAEDQAPPTQSLRTVDDLLKAQYHGPITTT